jgi:hypothetical protein
MGKVKQVLVETEEMLVMLLNDIGMTNDQAVKEIDNKLGSMASSYALEILKQWKEEDNEYV